MEYHNKKNRTITIEETWNQSDIVVLDVRSQKEFLAGSLPNAHNLPLLDNEERSVIGLLYKRCGKGAAIEKGYGILSPKLKSLQQYFLKFSRSQKFVVYCARGGMRSNVITSLMCQLGYDSWQLVGGYKTFRNWLLKRLDSYEFHHLVVLQGVTGVGKTLVLNQLHNSVDLEGLARHRGSLFGGVGKEPENQKNFEAKLLLSLDRCDNTRSIVLEGESRKIGDVSIPANIHQQMKVGTIFLLEASIETRTRRTVEEYITKQNAAIPLIKEKIMLLKQDLGKKKIDDLLRLFDQKNYFDCFKSILLEYYDGKYQHSMGRLNIESKVDAEDVMMAARDIEKLVS
ncbi:MAG: tRNA 2-selenouridine(34) synthase MnmH [Proteobacteria bacterium]|nr:tRNA 2-selenouridine(34) synthase MnmH [Pseudomonadota bacterium]